jgi:hypothetical protein
MSKELAIFSDKFTITHIFVLLTQKAQCDISGCDREADYRVIASNNNDEEVYLFLCAYHLNKIFWHGDP